MPSEDELKTRRERVQYIEPNDLEKIRECIREGAHVQTETILDLLDYIAHLESARWGLREELRKSLARESRFDEP